MTLLIGSPGLVRDGIAKALSPKGGAVVIEPDHDDPFGAAVDHEAIVYVPASSLTVGGPDSSPERMRAVLRAAHAPGVQVLIVVLPLAGYEDEVRVLTRDGKPYVVLRAPMLIEELGQCLDGRSLLLVQRNVAVDAVDVAAVADAVVSAIASEDQGRTIVIRGESVLASTALERAARATGKNVRVLGLCGPLLRALRWLARLFGRSEPVALDVLRSFALPAPGDGPPSDAVTGSC